MNERFEFRIDPAEKADIEAAASVEGLTASEFVRAAARLAARDVLARSGRTVVPPDYFDKLMAALDEPPEPNARVAEAASRLPLVVKFEFPGHDPLFVEWIRSAVRIRRQ